jgi:hypothetical protein
LLYLFRFDNIQVKFRLQCYYYIKDYSWFHETLVALVARLVGNLGTRNTRSSSWLETGQSNSEVSHQIIEIRYEIPNQVRKQVRKLQTILAVNFKNRYATRTCICEKTWFTFSSLIIIHIIANKILKSNIVQI